MISENVDTIECNDEGMDTLVEYVKSKLNISSKMIPYNFMKNLVKNHFGIEIIMDEWYMQLRLFNYLLSLNKKSAMRCITLGNEKMINEFIHVMQNKDIDTKYIASRFRLKNGVFIFKIDKATFIYVNIYGKSINDKTMELYIFGKNTYKELKNIRKYMSVNCLTYSRIHRRIGKEHTFFNTRECQRVDRNNLIIPDSTWNSILNYINHYKNIFYRLYKEHGIIKSGGILLYGNPGTGKTTLINAIATEYRSNVYYIDIEHLDACIEDIEEDNDDWGNYDSPLNICVFEDIDIFIKRRNDNKKIEDKAIFNKLLQFLDGNSSIPNSINIATTNDIHALDDAIIRDGRFDLKIKMDDLNEKLAKKLCDSFHADYSILDDEEFPINPAYLQSKIIQNL